MFLFKTALGEELLFRGYLLPRMKRASDAATGWRTAFFAGDHLHVPWAIPGRPPHVHARVPDEAVSERLDGRTAQRQSLFLAILILTSSSEQRPLHR